MTSAAGPGLPGPMLRVLDEEGVLVGDLPDLSAEQLRAFYRWMVFGRTLEQRAVTLQRQGRLGVIPPFRGQEGAYVGSVMPLRRSDWICPSYRDLLPALVHGLPLATAWYYYMGDPRGGWIPEPVRMLPCQTIICAQVVHAVGLAMASRYQGRDDMALAYCGDGATSEGDFHEALNMAGVFQAPVIFFCTNNHWAITTPRHRQTAAETLAQKAVAYGITGVQVDGMDALAVYAATLEAAGRARSGGGPTLIEAVAYRLGAHSTIDDPRRYRDDQEVQPWLAREPLLRFRRFLEARGLWSAAEEEALPGELDAEILAAFEANESGPGADPAWMFEKLYANPPAAVRARRDAVAEGRGR